MIKLLIDAFTVLHERGENCVRTLENEIRLGNLQSDKRIPNTVTERCLRIENPAREAVDDIADKLVTIRRIAQSLATGLISLGQDAPWLPGMFRSH